MRKHRQCQQLLLLLLLLLPLGVALEMTQQIWRRSIRLGWVVPWETTVLAS